VPALQGCELAHAWSARALELSWCIGRRLGVPATATLHDHPDTRTQTALRRRLWRLAANRQDAVAFPSAALEGAWRSAGFRRASRVIPNGSRGLSLRPRDPGRRDLLIGFLGMYGEWKGFAIAEAWARSGWPDHVRWAFYGETHPTLGRPAARLAADLGPRVRFAGRRPPDAIFLEVDVLVHCSTAFDPFPTVLIEAAQAGVPAVASALGGASEIVVHGETGFLFDPAAPEAGLGHLRRLVADPDLRARMGGAARARYEARFRAERMAEQYAAFWEGALRTSH
jgi:glycosyltransferase involved in cell wall biosynthesis